MIAVSHRSIARMLAGTRSLRIRIILTRRAGTVRPFSSLLVAYPAAAARCYSLRLKSLPLKSPPLKILFISPRQCWPPRSGAKLREYYFARALGERAELTYAYFSDPGEKPLTATQLPFCARIVSVPKPATYGAVNLARGIVGRWPVSVLNYTSGEMKNALAELPDARGFDLVHLDSIHMLRYTEQLGRAKVIYNWHNIESELMRRYGQTNSSAARRLYASHTAKKLEALERHILASAFGHIVCSEREREQLRRLAPKARVAVVENGVDTLHFAGNGGAPETGALETGALETKPRIVYVGKMDYHPNVEAVTAFVRDIWPKIHERMPSLRLCIVGADPPPVVTALREAAGVEVTGTVPDVSPYYRGSLASIVPLRTGGGTRLKILEAMAAETPVISTEVGAEGLAVTPGRDILIADASSPDAWLEHLTLLAGSPERRAQITAAGLELVRARYDWALLGQQLWSTYEGWLRSAD